ncbi:MAG: holo-ACP synthase, partial [Agromyces sp.]
MIAGIGIDVVDIARFERSLIRTPALRERLFAESERDRPARSLAARFAAKEALIKALGGNTVIRWHDMRIVQD